MKWFCRKSGIPLASAEDDYQSVLLSEHALFGLTRTELIKFLAKHPPASPIQKRLLFLACLNATGLVDWEAAFLPSDEEIELSMRELFSFISNLPEDLSIYPRVRITATNIPDMEHVLHLWKAVRLGIRIGEQASKEDIELAISEALNKYEIKGLKDSHREFVAFWLRRNSDKDEWQIDLFLDLLKLKKDTVKLQQANNLQALQDELSECLPDDDNNRRTSFYIQRHIQNLIDHLTSLGALIEGKDWIKKRTELAGITSYKIVELTPEETEEHRIAKAARLEAIRTRPMPQQKDFKSVADFALAKAEWLRWQTELDEAEGKA